MIDQRAKLSTFTPLSIQALRNRSDVSVFDELDVAMLFVESAVHFIPLRPASA